MLNLLIVDDEIYAVEGLKTGVEWSSLGFSGVYEAYNIKDAQEILRQISVDVVICDIEMPEGNGFELLEWIRGNYPEIISLFLTCHADFQYAQRAIQLGSQDYLLKPVNFSELKEVVRRLVASVQEERELKAAQEFAQAFWENKKTLLFERFWQDVLSSRLPASADQLRKALQEFTVPFDPDRMEVLPILISVEQWTQVFTERDEELMEYAIRKVAEEIILQGDLGCTVQDRVGANLVILYRDRTKGSDLDKLAGRCETFIQYCQRHFYCRASCYIGEQTAIERTKSDYEALLKMEYDNITKSHAVHLYKAKHEEPNHFHSVDLSDWPALIEQGDERVMHQRIQESLAALKFEGGNAEALLMYYHSVLQSIYLVLHKRGESVQKVFAEAGVLEPASFPKTIRQMEEWTIKVTSVVSRSVKTDEDSIVHQVKEYILAHLDERIERMELAELVHLNPAYLSRLFKKETGESLTDYILSRKMELSKQLLRSSNKPVSEIALVAGYSNLSYFSKAFKKMFDVSPMAYRKDTKLNTHT